jgi:hypothetical protein
MLPNVRGCECQDDIVLWYPGGNELFRDRSICAIKLDPDFAVFDIKVNHRSMYTSMCILSQVNDFIMILFGIDNCFSFNLAIRGLISRILLDHFADDVSVSVEFIHWNTFRFTSSK